MASKPDNTTDKTKSSERNKQSTNRTNKKINSDEPDIPEEQLAEQALACFNNNNFQLAFHYLQKLETIRSKDIKVLHNKAVCEFYKNGLSKTDEFIRVITDILVQNDNSKGHGRQVEWTGSPESSVAVVNLAVVNYYQHQYMAVIELLTPLFQSLNTLNAGVGVNVCLLLISSYLWLGKAENVLNIISTAESTFLPPSSDSQSSGRDAVTSAANKNYRNGLSSTVQESLQTRLQEFKMRCFIALKVIKPADKEFKAVIRRAVDAGEELKLNQICMKSQLKYLRGQFVKALSVLNTCAAIPGGISSVKGQRYPSINVWYYNNLALINMGLNKKALALHYMEQAIDQHKKDVKERGAVTMVDSSTQVTAVLSYNMGCILLNLNMDIAVARDAFTMFSATLQCYRANPRLWLYLAQCSIAVHKWEKLNEPDLLRVDAIGFSNRLHINQPPKPSDRNSNFDSAFLEPCLRSAKMCVQNALKLLPRAAPDTDSTEVEKPPELYTCLPSLPMRHSEAQRVRRAADLCAAYIFTSLGDYEKGLLHAVGLMAVLPTQDPAQASYRFLASLYACECCVMLDRLDEAMAYIKLDELSSNINTTDPWEKTSFSEDCSFGTSLDQQMLMRFNLCIIYALKREYNKSESLLNQIWQFYEGSKLPKALVMLAVYVNVRQRKTTVAADIVRRHLTKR